MIGTLLITLREGLALGYIGNSGFTLAGYFWSARVKKGGKLSANNK